MNTAFGQECGAGLTISPADRSKVGQGPEVLPKSSL